MADRDGGQELPGVDELRRGGHRSAGLSYAGHMAAQCYRLARSVVAKEHLKPQAETDSLACERMQLIPARTAVRSGSLPRPSSTSL